jgi:hypothetical protein
LLYGRYPSAAMKTYAEDIVTFDSKVREFKLPLPRLYEFVFNNFTSNIGVATAFDSVRNELIEFCERQYRDGPEIFAKCDGSVNTRNDWEEFYVSNTKDFHTAGKVSASLGIPLHRLPAKAKYRMPDFEEVKLPVHNYAESLKHMRALVDKIS